MKRITLIKWIARILGLLILLYLIFFYKIVQLPYQILETEQKGFSSIALFSFVVLGYIFAWYKEKEGGVMITFSALIFLLYSYYQPTNGKSDPLIFILLLLATGLLFWWIGKEKTKISKPN